MVGVEFDTCADETVAPITTTVATSSSATTRKENAGSSVSGENLNFEIII